MTTDTRNCPEGSMFIALKGDTFNGNAFARQALEKGCRYAVVDEAEYAGAPGILLVDDCLKTLQMLAREHRRTMGTRIIGITGTNGKTTTKELIATVLQKRYNVLYTQGNLNNHIGVPLTLLGLTEEHELAVVEMGANHPGEIRTLVNIVEPDCGLITNVGKAHLEGFGSFEGVVKTKSELYDYLRSKENAFTFLDKDNEVLCQASAGLETICYGLEGEGLYVKGKLHACAPFLAFEWEHEGRTYDVNTHLIGAYNVKNALAAIAIGCRFEVPLATDRDCRQPSHRRCLQCQPYQHDGGAGEFPPHGGAGQGGRAGRHEGAGRGQCGRASQDCRFPLDMWLRACHPRGR